MILCLYNSKLKIKEAEALKPLLSNLALEAIIYHSSVKWSDEEREHFENLLMSVNACVYFSYYENIKEIPA